MLGGSFAEFAMRLFRHGVYARGVNPAVVEIEQRADRDGGRGWNIGFMIGLLGSMDSPSSPQSGRGHVAARGASRGKEHRDMSSEPRKGRHLVMVRMRLAPCYCLTNLPMPPPPEAFKSRRPGLEN